MSNETAAKLKFDLAKSALQASHIKQEILKIRMAERDGVSDQVVEAESEVYEMVRLLEAILRLSACRCTPYQVAQTTQAEFSSMTSSVLTR